MDPHGPGVAEAPVSPDLLHELLGGDHPAGMRGQIGQEIELGVGERERPARKHSRSAAHVDHQFADHQTIPRTFPGTTRTSSRLLRHLIPRSSFLGPAEISVSRFAGLCADDSRPGFRGGAGA